MTNRGLGRWNALLYFVRRDRSLFSLMLATSVMLAVLETVSVAALLPFLTALFPGEGRSVVSTVGQSFIKVLDWMPIRDKVAAGAVLVIVATAVKGGVGVVAEYVRARAAGTLLYQAKRDLLGIYTGAPYGLFLDLKQGDLIYVAMSATQRLALSFAGLAICATELLRVGGILVLFFLLQPAIALVSVVAVGLLYWIVAELRRRESYSSYGYSLGQQRAQAAGDELQLLTESITGVKQIRIAGAAGRWRSLFDRANRLYASYYTKDALLVAMPKHLLEVMAIVLFFGALLVLHSVFAARLLDYVPLMGVLGIAILKLLPSLSLFVRTRFTLTSSLKDIEGLHEMLTSGRMTEQWPGTRDFAGFHRSIAFDDVWLSHDGRRAVLRGFTATFAKNSVTAIVGESGAGKTTVINLLLGLYRPDRGTIRVDGEDLAGFTLPSWRARIGLVSQDTFIFHGSVADNIAFGDGRFSRDDIVRAARLANAHAFISELPEGYDTLVGERGLKLSGGQQQRIAIARAVLREPEILIFDEATSALDAASEGAVHDAIMAASWERTVILVAHRLSTVQGADAIIVLDDGRVVETGTHRELMDRNELYRAMVESQTYAHAEPKSPASTSGPRA